MNDIKGLSHLKFQFKRARTVLTAIAVLKPLAAGFAAFARLCLALTPLTYVKTLRPHKEKIFCSSRRICAGIAAPKANKCGKFFLV